MASTDRASNLVHAPDIYQGISWRLPRGRRSQIHIYEPAKAKALQGAVTRCDELIAPHVGEFESPEMHRPPWPTDRVCKNCLGGSASDLGQRLTETQERITGGESFHAVSRSNGQ